MDRFVDHHNISAVTRTCEGMGILNVHVISSDYLKNYAARSVTKNSDKWLNLHYYESAKEILPILKENGYQIWTAHLSKESTDLHKLHIPDKIALVLGSEKDGPSEDTKELTDKFIYLPIHGFIESYNVSVASALLLQLIKEKRTFNNLSEELYLRTKHQYYLKSVKFADRLLNYHWKNN